MADLAREIVNADVSFTQDVCYRFAWW